MPSKVLFLTNILLLFSLVSFSQGNKGFQTLKEYQTQEARQGVAVDKKYFFTINSTGIAKYDKKDGLLVVSGIVNPGNIIHLDGGVVVRGLLYCAHSNYPGIPMKSSLEIFSAADLKHIGSHIFDNNYGSCTWADFYRNSWWVCFAHYDQFSSQTGKGSEGTVLVRYDKNWKETGKWSFPDALITEVRPMSVSGGSWGPDGYLYVTGHDSSRVYILKVPRKGNTMEMTGSESVGFQGQGIAWDRSTRNSLYGIIRKTNTVIVSNLE